MSFCTSEVLPRDIHGFFLREDLVHMQQQRKIPGFQHAGGNLMLYRAGDAHRYHESFQGNAA